MFKIGKGLSTIGYIMLAFLQLIAINFMRNNGLGSIFLLQILAFSGLIFICGGFSAMYIDNHNSIDLGILLLMGISLILEILTNFLHVYPPEIIYIMVDVAIYLLIIVNLIQDISITKMILVVMVVSAMCFRVFGRNILDMVSEGNYIYVRIGYIICNIICAIYCATKVQKY